MTARRLSCDASSNRRWTEIDRKIIVFKTQ
jgi:hypothetical protein